VRRFARLLALGSYVAGVVVDPAGVALHHAWHALRGEDGAHAHDVVVAETPARDHTHSHPHPHTHFVHPWFGAGAHSHAPVVDALLKLSAGTRDKEPGTFAAAPQLEHLSPSSPGERCMFAPTRAAGNRAAPDPDSPDLRPPVPPPVRVL
jgi:hypothetical protein